MKIPGIMRHDGVFRAEELAYLEHNPPTPREGRAGVESAGTDNFWVAFLAIRAGIKTGAWLITDHHLAATFTNAGGRLTFMPLFLGAMPQELGNGSEVGARIISHEAIRGFDLLQALTPKQLRAAVVSPEVMHDVMTGNGRRDSLKGFEGLPAAH